MYKITLNNAIGVVPELDEVLRQVFMKRPSLRYLARGIKEDLAYSLDVYDGIDHVGSVMYGSYRPYRGETKLVYQLQSPKINKDRAPNDTILTSNSKVAVKTLLNEEVYARPDDEKKVSQVLTHAEYRMESIISSLSYNVSHLGNNLNLNKLLVKIVDGETIDIDARFPEISKFVDKNRKTLAEIELAEGVQKTMEAKNYHVVKYEIDESLSMFSAKDRAIVYNGNSTYDLPDWAQSKLAMLKVVDPKQVMRHVGFKFHEDNDEDKALYYVLLDGEIPDLIE